MNDLIINLTGAKYTKRWENDFAITCGVFDLFHAGHKELLEIMVAKGKKTVVFLHDDKSTYQNKNKFPVQSFEHRAKNLQDTKLVDYIFKIENPNPGSKFELFFSHVNPRENKIIYLRGDDWKDAPGLEVIRDYGVEIQYKKYKKGISSTKIRDGLNK